MKGKAFNLEEDRAICSNRKTQFREIIKIRGMHNEDITDIYPDGSGKGFIAWEGDGSTNVSAEETVKMYPAEEGFKPKYEVGEVIYVEIDEPGTFIDYITYYIKITTVRAEKIQDIIERDAIAEGVERITSIGPMRAMGWKDYAGGIGFFDATESFKSLWVKTNGQESWEKDWVFVYDFEKTERP